MGPHDVDVDKTLTPRQKVDFSREVRLTRPQLTMTKDKTDGRMKAGVPDAAVDSMLLDREQSAKAHNTHIHSLQMLEYLILSGELTIKEMLDATKTLAEYQFQKASQRAKHQSDEKTVEDYLQEIEEQFQSDK